MLAIMQHQYPIAQPNQFFIITAVEQNGFAFIAELSEQRIKLSLGAHIHTFGWIVQQQQPRAGASAICRCTTFCALPPDRLLTGSCNTRHFQIQICSHLIRHLFWLC